MATRKRKCPHCSEVVLADARVCRYCGRDLPPPNQEEIVSSRVGRFFMEWGILNRDFWTKKRIVIVSVFLFLAVATPITLALIPRGTSFPNQVAQECGWRGAIQVGSAYQDINSGDWLLTYTPVGTTYSSSGPYALMDRTSQDIDGGISGRIFCYKNGVDQNGNPDFRGSISPTPVTS